ncbi:hypothetical protein [Streptomyces anulatus]|uniref:hypothetical protein n=1 Tax=Streptomyces anulatus TaxID=1892 RepID=UPI00365A97FE
MMASSSYRGLVAVLQGLRARGDRVIERMALPTTTTRGQIRSVLASTRAGTSPGGPSGGSATTPPPASSSARNRAARPMSCPASP